jgi:hypothetical protein
MKSLQTILKEETIQYFKGINERAGVDCIKFKKSMTLEELLVLVKISNSSEPYRAIGQLTVSAVEKLENKKV